MIPTQFPILGAFLVICTLCYLGLHGAFQVGSYFSSYYILNLAGLVAAAFIFNIFFSSY